MAKRLIGLFSPEVPDEEVAERIRSAVWTCPRCGRSFAARNQAHACAPPGNLDDHFEGKSPVVREIFDRIVAVVTEMGPVEIIPQKSRIALHARVSFAVFVPRTRWLNGHLVLAERVESPRFVRIESLSARNHVHSFRLHGVAEVDDEFVGWLRLAYEVGRQKHLVGSPPQTGGAPLHPERLR